MRPRDTAREPLGPEAVEPQEGTRAQKHPHVWKRSPCGRGTCGPGMNVGRGGEGPQVQNGWATAMGVGEQGPGLPSRQEITSDGQTDNWGPVRT